MPFLLHGHRALCHSAHVGLLFAYNGAQARGRRQEKKSSMLWPVLLVVVVFYCPRACSAFFALWRADRRPYKRAQKEVNTSIISWTRSPLTSELSMTRSLRSWAVRAASTYSAPKRINRSRCSTTMVWIFGLASSFMSLGRRPFRPEPPRIRLEQWSSDDCERKPRGGLIVLPNPFFGPTRKLGRRVRRHEPES